MSERPPVLFYRGLPCRLAARRPDGKVLVEWLMPRSHAALGSWTEAMPSKLENSKMSPDQLQQLIALLPEAEFINDRHARSLAGDYWFQKI